MPRLIPPNPYTCIGFDFTITPPKGHVPPSRSNAASSNKLAPAVRHLTDEERHKLMRDGKGGPYNQSSLTGEEIVQRLYENNEVLIPLAISPYGQWDPSFITSSLAHFWPTPLLPGHTLRSCTHAPCTILALQVYCLSPQPLGIVSAPSTNTSTATHIPRPRQRCMLSNSWVLPSPTPPLYTYATLSMANS